jgi:hypothetical protein
VGIDSFGADDVVVTSSIALIDLIKDRALLSAVRDVGFN